MRPTAYDDDGYPDPRISERAKETIRRMFGGDFRAYGPVASDAAVQEFAHFR